jgi:PAS domain S-box-containing protein
MLSIVLGSGLLCAQTPPPADRPSPPTRRVLLVSEQNLFSPTGAYVDDGIQDSLRESKYRIEIDREFLDVQQFNGEAEQKLIRDLLVRKYRDHKPDVIITTGAPTLRFIAKEYRRDFAGIPVIYCFPNGADEDVKSDPEVTGVTMRLDAAATLTAALHMLPRTRRVFVITGTAPYDLTQIQGVKKQLADFSSRVDIAYLAGLAMPDLRKQLSSLPKDSIVLFVTHSRDGAGNYFDFQENGSLISSASNAPVFSLIDVQIGYGQVGGYFAKSREEGTIAGRDALKILDGGSPSQIPVAIVPNGFVFDWRALQRWGINETNLPPGSTILNRPRTAWEQYKAYILGGLALMLLEAMLIFGLLLNRARARRAEAELRHNQMRLAGLIETALDAIVAVDEEQRIVLFNAAAERIFGCPAASAIGSSLGRFIPQRFRAAHGAHIRQFGETGTTNRKMGVLDNLSGLRANGEEFPIEASISQVETSGKKLYTVILRDVTERRQAAEELQKEKAFTEAVIDSLPDIFFVIQPTGEFLHWGRNPERILGYSSEDTEAMSQAVEIVAQEDRAAATRAIEEAFSSGSVTVEVQLLHKDGQKIPYLLRATRALIGNEYLLVGVGLNITERKQTEEALMQSEERFRTVFEKSGMGIILMDLTGHPLQTNPAFQRMIGYSENELHAMSFTDFTHPDHRENDWQVFSDLLQDKFQSKFEMEKRYVRKDGQIVWARLTLSLIKDIQGQPQYTVAMVQDITERKLAEEALRSREAQLREAEHIANFGSSTWDVDTDTTTWSPEMYRILGWDPAQPAPQNADRRAIYSPESWKLMGAAVERALATGEPYNLEVQFTRRDGAVRWGFARGRATFDDAGRVIRLHGTLQDITERKLAEEKIKASEENYLLLLNSTAEGIFGIDVSGICTFCNPASLRILGYERSEELLGSDMHQRMHHSYADGSPYPVDRCPIRTSLQEGKGCHIDDEVMWRKDGSSFSAEYWSHPIFKAGKIAGGVITFLDVSTRRRAVEAMLRLRQAVEASGEVVIMTDLQRRITFVNPQFTRTFGYGQEEAIGEEPRQVLNSETVADSEYEDIWRTLLTKQFARYELINKSKDGRKLVMDCSANTVLDDRGEVVGTISIQRDVTQRKHLEQQLLQAQKMEAVGRLAGGVAHDFNNILGIITGYTELTLEDPTLAERPKERLAEIRNAANRAIGITRQLLTFSRKQVLETRILNLNEIVQETAKMLGRLLGEDIEVAIVLDPNLGFVRADPTGIDQIILNLAVNARDAMPDGGKLTIETANATFEGDSSTRHGTLTAGDYVALTMSDTGVGMDEETQRQIFEPFFTTKEKGRGTGLGLSTVFGIVEQSGGSIWTYSEVGRGTTFKIYLPRTVAAKPSVTSESTEMIRGDAETILLAEDDSGLRKLNGELLRDLGYNVIEAVDGADALRIIEQYQEQLHLLLTDVVMPGMNGQQLAEKALLKRPTLKVLFVSGYASGAVGEKIKASGAAFLQKPLSRNVLAKALREILDSTDTSAGKVAAAKRDA